MALMKALILMALEKKDTSNKYYIGLSKCNNKFNFLIADSFVSAGRVNISR